MESLSRRQFIIGATITGVALAGGAFAKGMADPRASDKAEFPEGVCQDPDSDGPRILVAYTSEFGTTGGVADAMRTELCSVGFAAESRRASSIKPDDLATYDAVIVGGPIQYDRWMSEARRFVIDNEDQLSRVPVACFLTCMTLSKPSAEAAAKVDGYASKLAATSARVNPLSVGRFAGVLDYSLMSPLSRGAARIVYTAARVSEGDYRDWEAISAWATGTSQQLS